MVKALFDTNILIDYLGGVESARAELGRYDYRAISMISWMEVLVGTSASDEAPIRAWAQVNGLLLVSRNTKDFPATEPGVRVPYQI